MTTGTQDVIEEFGQGVFLMRYAHGDTWYVRVGTIEAWEAVARFYGLRGKDVARTYAADLSTKRARGLA